MAVINEDQSLLVGSPVGAPDGHICSQTSQKMEMSCCQKGDTIEQTQSKSATRVKERFFGKPSISGIAESTVESILVEVPQRSQRGAKPAVSLLAHQVGLTGLQQQRAPLKVHVDLTQLLQTAAGSLTHEHRSPHQEVIQAGDLNKNRRQMV